MRARRRGAHRSHPDDRGRGAGDAAEDAAGRARVRARDQPDRGVVLQPHGKRRRGSAARANQLNAYYFATGNPGLLQRGPVALSIADGGRHSGGGRVLAALQQARRADRRAGEKAMTMQAAAALLWALALAGARLRRRPRRHQRPAQQPPDRSAPPKPGTAAGAEAARRFRNARCRTGCRSGSSSCTRCRSSTSRSSVKAGSGADPRAKFGVANLTAEMLDEGAGARDALQIADAHRLPRRQPVGLEHVRRGVRGSARAGRASRQTRCRSWRTSRCGRRSRRRSCNASARSCWRRSLQAQDDPGGARPVCVPAARLRPEAPLRHDAVRDRGVAEELHGRGSAAVSRRVTTSRRTRRSS